ncbi:NAD-dependent epimerase [Bacteroides sp.]
MRILVTGCAGFIGFHIAKRLLSLGYNVVGLDNLNAYYDINLKYARLAELGISENEVNWYRYIDSTRYANFRFIRMNLEDKQAMQMLFGNGEFDTVCNFAAQAGVRYSITNPYAYIESNIDGFMNILEGCRYNNVSHLIYASSSSVYGLNTKVPFSEKDCAEHPVSLYAATKKSNELMAHAYSHLYGLPTTGLRFFTVYGPWGRPDMAPFLFTDAILHNRVIKIFNNGDMLRDFTYIDDITEGIVRVISSIPNSDKAWNSEFVDPGTSSAPYRIYNIGNSNAIKLMDFIKAIEMELGVIAEKQYLSMQQGDVYQTYADVTRLYRDFHFTPNISITEGVKRTIDWYRKYYNI